MVIGLVLTDPAGRVISLNAAAREWLPVTDGLVLENGFLSLPPLDSPPPSLLIPLNNGSPPLRMTVATLSNGTPRTCHVVVTFTPSLPDANARREFLLRRFNLTVAEARLAEQVLEGVRPARAAENLRITLHTVRTYLKRLYVKTGVNDRAGLVAVLMKAVEDF